MGPKSSTSNRNQEIDQEKLKQTSPYCIDPLI